MVMIPQWYYRCQDFYGDFRWHNQATGPLSVKDPLEIIIGETTTIASRWGQCTKLKSNCLWRYGYAGGDSSRYYSTSTGSNGNTYIRDLGVGVSDSVWYTIPSSGVVEEAYITSASDGQSVTKLSRIYFSGNSLTFEPSITCPTDSVERAVVIKFKQSYSADLPSNMYTINNNTITWLDSPILRLLHGFVCIPY